MEAAVEQMVYPKYELYKDSGENWLGEVPNHWDVKKLKHIFYEKKFKANPTLNCGSISFGKVVTKDDEKIPLSTKASYQELLCGEFLINPLNLNYDLISLRIALSDLDVVVSPGYIIIKNFLEIDKGYFKYLLHRYDVAYMKLLGSGVRQTISFNHIADSLLAVPPKEEQNKIAFFLDKKTVQIDQAIARKERQIELLKDHRQILIHKALTRGLDPNLPMKDSGVEWIGEIPMHWGFCKLKLLVEVKDGTHDTPAYVEAGENTFPLATTKHVTSGTLRLEEASHISLVDYIEISRRSNVASGDIIMPMIGTIGSPLIVSTKEKFAIKNLALFKTSSSHKIEAHYLLYLLQSDIIKNQFDKESNGGVLGFMSLGQLRNLFIPLISLKEQGDIVAEIKSISAKINGAILLKEKEIDKLKEYRASLINAAVTGKIKVTLEEVA